MRHLRLIGVCLAALFALGAVAANAASATEPALYECAKVTKANKGKGIWNKGCKVEGKHGLGENEYEIQEWNLTSKKGKVKPFKGKGGLANLEATGVGVVTCAKSASEGKFSGPKSAAGIKVTFTGCSFQGIKCENTATAGEIKPVTLAGTVGYINKEKHEVGVDIFPETGTVDAEFHCETHNFIVEGSVIGQVTSPLNKFTKEANLNFETSSEKQVPEKLEGFPIDTLTTGVCGGCVPHAEAPAGESTRVSGKGEELELKA